MPPKENFQILSDIDAEDLSDAIVKVKRVGQSVVKPGTILVEIKTEDCKIKIMKAKKVLLKHSNLMKRKVKVRNMKSKEQMMHENNLYQLLSLLPNGDRFGLIGV